MPIENIIEGIFDFSSKLVNTLFAEPICLCSALAGLICCPTVGCCSLLGAGGFAFAGLYPAMCGLSIATLPCSILLFVPPLCLVYAGDVFVALGCSIACSSCGWWWCTPCGMSMWGVAMGCLSAGTCLNTTMNLSTIMIVTLCPVTSAPFGFMMGCVAKFIAIPQAVINIPCMAIGWCCGLPMFLCCPICPTSIVFCDWGCWHTCWEFSLLQGICTLCSVPAISSVKCLSGLACPCCWL